MGTIEVGYAENDDTGEGIYISLMESGKQLNDSSVPLWGRWAILNYEQVQSLMFAIKNRQLKGSAYSAANFKNMFGEKRINGAKYAVTVGTINVYTHTWLSPIYKIIDTWRSSNE